MELLRTFMFVTVVSCLGVCLDAHSLILRQERAFVICNPKYALNCKAYTARLHRGGSYTTNITGTALRPFDGNCTVSINFKLKSVATPVGITMNLCELFNTKWAANFIRKYSNISATCPVPVGKYKFTNIVLPPKDFPLLIPAGKNTANVSFFHIDKHELMLSIHVTLYVD